MAETLLFTNLALSKTTRIGRSDAAVVTQQVLNAMNLQYTVNGGETLVENGQLVMRNFIQRILGPGAMDLLIQELPNQTNQTNQTNQANQANQAPPHTPLFFADYEENESELTYRVYALHSHPTVQRARNMAAMWCMQDHPLVGCTEPSQPSSSHQHVKGRKVYFCVCIRPSQLPFKDDNVELFPGDVHVKCVGLETKTSPETS